MLVSVKVPFEYSDSNVFGPTVMVSVPNADDVTYANAERSRKLVPEEVKYPKVSEMSPA